MRKAFVTIPLEQLREPKRPARTILDTAELEALSVSIRDLGVLLPLHVKAVDGNMFEVIAGHRRLLAARMAGVAGVPCLVETDEERADAVKLHENLLREELSPCDEALYYAELYERLGEDVDAVARMVRRTRGQVESRLLLVRGDPAIFAALRAGTILLGVAEQLNKIRRSEDRAYYLLHAERGGCSVKTAVEWRLQANGRAELAELQAADAPAASGAAAPAAPAPVPGPSYVHYAPPHELSGSEELRECMFCQQPQLEWRMYRKHVCSPCADKYLVPGAPPPQAGHAG